MQNNHNLKRRAKFLLGRYVSVLETCFFFLNSKYDLLRIKDTDLKVL